MRLEGNCVTGGATNLGGVPVPTRAVPSGRDILTDLARKHSRTPVITLSAVPAPVVEPAVRKASQRRTRELTGAAWLTEPEKAQIVRLYREGRTVRQIADELDRYVTTVRRYLNGSGIPLRDDRAARATPAAKAQAIADVLAGTRMPSAIAVELGVHQSTVHGWVKAARARQDAA